MLLLIGDRDDPHLQELCVKLRQTQSCEILSTLHDDLINTQFSFYSQVDGTYSCYIKQLDKEIYLADITLAFCLSPLFRLEGLSQAQESRFWYFSWKEALYGFYSLLALEKKFINKSVENCLACQNKILTFPMAHKVGLKIPNSSISNSRLEINSFFNKNSQVVLKTLHQMSLYLDSEPTMLLTQKVAEQDFLNYTQENESPLFLQGYIDKLYDIRLIVTGSEVLACKIDASRSQSGKVDYRAYDLPNTPHYQVEVPLELKNKIIVFCQAIHIEYACIDLCVDSTQQYWLLDINPFGRYLWMEYATGMPITRTLAQFLSSRQVLPT